MNIQQAQIGIVNRDKRIKELEGIISKFNDGAIPEIQSTEKELNVEALEAILEDKEAMTKIAGHLSASMFDDEEVQENVHKKGLLSAGAPMDVSFWIRLATQIIQVLIEAFKK